MQHQLHSDQLQVSINAFGAEICSVKNKSGTEFIWQADRQIWARHAPVLFPIVGKLANNTYRYQGKDYELPQHGFARDMAFDLAAFDENSCTFQLNASAITKTKFPFDFCFEISYRLTGALLTISYKVKNTSQTEELPFSVGAHPGFNCPLLPDEKFEDYYIEVERESLQQTKLKDGLRSNEKIALNLKDKRLFLSQNLFENDALVFENGQIDSVSLCSLRSQHKITLQCNNWPYFGIWTKKGCKQFVCLEPWHGITSHENANNQFANKEGIIRLQAQKQFEAGFSIAFS